MSTNSLLEMTASLANNFASSQDRQTQQSPDSDDNSKKRKSEDAQQPQQRAKRNRYISIACNECKRRKIKCNGQTPCQRCGNLNLECVYAPNCCNGFKDSVEYKQMSDQIAMLQEQVGALWDITNNLRAQLGGQTASLPLEGSQYGERSAAIDPTLQALSQSQRGSVSGQIQSPGAPIAPMSPNATRPRSQASHQPRFHGPTSSQFNFGVAKSSLQTMGITSQQEERDDEGSGGAGSNTREASPDYYKIHPSYQVLPTLHHDKDPIWAISREDAVGLCRVYEDEMGLMYPVLNIEQVIAHAEKLYRFMEAAHRSGLVQQGLPGSDGIEDEDSNILKLVLASAMTVRAAGQSELGKRMFEYVQPAIDRMLLGSVGVKGIRILTLAAMYEFHRDNEGTSWRIIGLAARLCIELGLHRLETYESMTNDRERDETLLLLWAIYVLDRRWSFGTGMPFSLQDGDIDPRLPRPEEKSPYLTAMIAFSHISSKVWHSVAARSGMLEVNVETMGYLDYQVIQWHRNIPPELRFQHPAQNGVASTPVPPPRSRAERRLRMILYLRANTMRIHIYRPVLHTATMIIKHRDQAQTVVDISKDSIRVLTHINQTTDLYRSQQALFNAFLTSALAVLFLAVSHTPAIFADNVRDEFHMALDLVRGLSKGSWVSKRLWKTIRVLKEVGPKLGLAANEGEASNNNTDHNNNNTDRRAQQRTHQRSNSTVLNDEIDPSRSAAVAMAGLAGHNVDETALFAGRPSASQPWGSTSASTSPDNIANDLSTLFEAAGGYHQAGGGESNGQQASTSDFGAFVPNGGAGHNAAAAMFGGEDGLSHILKELF